MLQKNLSNNLNCFRWTAALMVVIGHLRSFLFVDYGKVEHHTLFSKGFYFITGFGHQAVIVFFIISGYLVGGAVLKKYKAKQLNNDYIKVYFIKRFSRIYAVLIPALLIGYLFDNLGSFYFSDLYHNMFHISAMNYDVVERLHFITLFGNIMNVQTILVPTLGSNGPLWSLANEWWYYMLFILLFINNVSRVIFFLLIFILLFMNEQILVYSSIWLMGAFLVTIKKKILPSYIAIIFFLVLLVISRKISGILIDFSLALSFVFMLNSLSFNTSITNENSYKINHLLAKFSYFLYLFHFLFLVLMIALFHLNNVNLLLLEPTLLNITYCILFLILIYIYSFAMYLLFEKRTDTLTYFFKNKLMRNL